MKQLLGVVMCGGKSLRMGTDKGLIPQGNQTWAQIAFDKLAALGIPVIASVNPHQVEAYSRIFKAGELVVDELTIPGPLNGILSVHAAYPDKSLLILACDMISMDDATLKSVIREYQSQLKCDFYAYHNGDFYEPLCAIYTAQALQKINADTLSNFSLQTVLKQGNTKQLRISNPVVFQNQNSR